MTPRTLVEVTINPLSFPQVEEPWASALNQPITIEVLTSALCTPGLASDLKEFLKRYQEISTEPAPLIYAPAEPRILEKLVWPLRHAKMAHALGNYLGTIALCGTVAEMLAILLWDLSNADLPGALVGREMEKQRFGCLFEKLGQDERVRALAEDNLIVPETKANFDTIRTTRRRYLHLWSQDHDRLPPDSVHTYHCAVSLARVILGQEIIDGKIVLPPRLAEYLTTTGTIQHASDDGT